MAADGSEGPNPAPKTPQQVKLIRKLLVSSVACCSINANIWFIPFKDAPAWTVGGGIMIV